MKFSALNVVWWCWCVLQVFGLPHDIVIGGIFDSTDDQQALAFSYAVERVNADAILLPRSVLQSRLVNLTSDDSFQAAKQVCYLLRQGVAAIFGPKTEKTANHVQSICDAMEVPHIETRWHYQKLREAYSINLHPYPPSLSLAYKNILMELQWTNFVILYDNNESLIRIQSLLKEDSWTFSVRKLDDSGDYRPMLKEIKLSNANNIVIDVSKDKIFEILHQAALVGLMTDYQHYFITNLDFNQINLEPFSKSGPNITGIQLVDPRRRDIQRLVEGWKTAELLRYGRNLPHFRQISTDAALIYDAVILFASALTELDNSKQVDIHTLNCEGGKTWQHGNSLINYMKLYSSLPGLRSGGGMKGGAGAGGIMVLGGTQAMNRSSAPLQYDQVRVMGLTGLIKFSVAGFREDFGLDILEMDGGGLKKVGSWSRTCGANYTRTWIENVETVEKQLRDKNIVVCTALTKPYTMLKESSNTLTGNDKYEGFCIDLIRQIANDIGFNFTIVIAPDGAYGTKNNKTGEWNGIVKQLLDHQADLGIVDFTITYEREEAVDFTMPFMNLGISIIFKKPMKAPPQLFSFISPFSVDVWIYMATAYLGVSVLLFFLARIAPNEWDNPHPCIQDPDELENSISLSNAFWFTIGSLMQQGSDIAPKAVSTRIVAGIWWFFTLIMISSYTANLAAFLTVERMEATIQSVEDLAGQNVIKYGCKDGGSTHAFFRESSIPTFQKMWQVMSTSQPSVFTKSNDVGVERVQNSDGLYAFLMESSSIEYEVERKCDLMRVGGLLDSKSYGIALRPGSPYTNRISGAILKLKERGELHRLKEKWWKRKGALACQGDASKKKSGGAAELGLANVGGVFVVLIGGMAIATIMAICEFMWNALDLATDQSASYCDELSSEVKFIISCAGNTKPVRKKTPSTPEDPLFTYGSYGANYGYSQRK